MQLTLLTTLARPKGGRATKTVLAGLLVALVLASLLIITIQAEDMALSSNMAEIPSLVTERWGANSTAEYPANTIDATLNGLYPDWSADNGTTLIIRSGGGFDAWALLYFDVSNLPVTTTVRSASLHLYLYAHCQCDVYETVHQILDPDGLGLWDEDDATFNQRWPDVPWSNTAPGDLTTVVGPELDRAYFGTHGQWSNFWTEWDVTAAVQDWVANPAANSGLLLPHIEDALYTADSSESASAELRPYLQITYEGPNPNRPAQVSGLDVFHRSGQTFITWDEIGSGNPSEAYYVYRHDAPITASNLDEATLLVEVPAGSGYYENEDVGCSAGSNCSPIGQSRFIIQDDSAPLPEGRGLFVYTVHDDQWTQNRSEGIAKSPPLSWIWRSRTSNSENGTSYYAVTSAIEDQRTQNRSEGIAKSPPPSWIWRSRTSNSENGTFYYAVTSLVEGNENRQDFSAENALTPGIAESEATPQPVRVWTNDTGTGWVYTQFMDYHQWNPVYEGYAYNFYVGVPPGYPALSGRTGDPDGGPWPLLVQLHAYTGSYRLPASSSAGTDYDWPAIQVFPDDRSNTWWYGFGELFGHEAPLRDGLIVNYTEQRLEQIIDWVIQQFNVDLNRVYLWGGSMGGSGTLLFGLRQCDLFAAIYAESGMTNMATTGDAGGSNWVTNVDWRWGTPEENIATNHGPGIWDWYNLQGWVADNPGAELPFLADHHGQNDDTTDWETQGLPWYPALEDGRHGFVGVFSDAGHGWPGFVADHPNFTLTDFNFPRNESFPGFANASNSDDPATSTGCRNCRLEWSSSANNFAGLPTDTADLYELVIRTNDGGDATVDVTLRRLQQFVVTPGHSYAWENERVSDSAVVQSGTVAADSYGLITVPAFAVSASGNRLRLEPAGPVNLTADSTANDQNPAWSPDGQRLVFTSGRSGNNELWLMDDDALYQGSDPTALTSNGAENVNLPGRAWCPGNDRIVFASDVESENDEVFSIASNGTDVQRVTETTALNWEPSWSPDCSQIVFQSDRSGNPSTGSGHSWDLWRMNADGSSPVQLTADPADDWEPNWSPDGTTIVFQSLRSGNWDLWTMDVNGGSLTNLTNDPAEDSDPSWSPDGTRIVYSSDRGADDGSLWAIEASGGTPIQITDDPAYDGAPSWSPDGSRIAFESERSGNLDIWVVDAPVAPSPTETPTATPTPTVTPTPTSPPCDLTGDLDGDGDVDIADIMLVASLWHTAEGDPDYDPTYDLDGNGVIDIVDIMLVAIHWGEDCTTPTATPTPTATATATATATPTTTTTPGALDIPLTVTDDTGVARVSDPVTSGVPLPRAANITDAAQLQITADGQPVPAQFTPLARWGGAPDDTSKPIKWVLVDFQANVDANSSATYHLTLADGGGSLGFRGITVSESPTRWGGSATHPNKTSASSVEPFGTPLEVDTGVARFVISEMAFGLFEQIYLDRDGDGAVDDALLAGPGEIVATAGGVTYRADTRAPSEVVVELAGELHTVIRVRGRLRSAGGDKLLAYTARLHFYAGQPTARIMFTVWNDNPMVNDGAGQPDIKAFGSPNTVLFDDLSLSLQLADASSTTYILAGGPGETWSGALTSTAQLYQDSSGGPQWNHAPDNTANTFRGFQAQANGATLRSACTDDDDEDTCRSEGWGGLLASDGAIVAGVRHFWQNYPKAIDLSADGTVSIGLFPGQYSQDFELRVGEQKTHEVLFYPSTGSGHRFGADDVASRMTALHNPLRAWASSEYYLDQAGVFDRAAPHNAAAFADFEGYVDAAILYDQVNLLWLRDGGVDSGWYYAPRPEAWGWRNFGDTIAEDETNGDGYPIFTNQQYDHPWVAILQMIRSLDIGGGRPDLWWQLAESGARHQADVDVIHSLCTGWPPDEMIACMDAEQGPPYATGWAMGGRLTNQHHADPSPNLHRHALIDYWSGGIRGMLYYYYLTGDGTVKDAWLEMAENARWRVDNSPCDPSCGPGYAQNNPGEGDARAPAYALEIMTDTYAATGDTAYLASAQDVVAESHPDNTWFGQPGFTLDPNVSPSGKQTSPWALGMIMKSLGRYLDMTAEWTGTPDLTAQDSLLRYAELQADWWRLGEDEPTCYYFGENGGCTPQAQNYFLADGMAWGLVYDDGGADRALWENVAADAWQKSEDEPWGPGYAKDTFLTAKTHIMHANNGVAWRRYTLESGLVQ